MTNQSESKSLRFLYNNAFGRVILKLLTARWISKLCGAFLDTSLSKPLIKGFVKNNNINLDDFESDNFTCFNDCFCRKIKDGRRTFPTDENVFFAPCDGLLSAYRITDKTVLPIKQSAYTINRLLDNDVLADDFKDGVCLVFRLCVNHYHRYCYSASGRKGNNIFIKGKLHTVRPIALEAGPVFCENCREYTVIDTDHFGKIAQIEVGAMLVGKIKNHHGAGNIKRTWEKGMFLYGGSTIVMLLQKDKVNINEKFFENTANNIETDVVMGQPLN